MGIDPSIYRLCQELTCVTHHADREVMDLAACLAYEVVVIGGSEIEVYRTIAAGKADDLTEFHQKIQISVYRTKTDIWKFFSDGEVERVGGRMIRTIHQTSLDRLSLSAVLKSFHLKPPSVYFVIMIIVIIIIAKTFQIVNNKIPKNVRKYPETFCLIVQNGGKNCEICLKSQIGFIIISNN